MKMIGMSIRSAATRFCRSRPLRPGRSTSSTRQLGARTRGRERNSCADANVSGCQPAQRISASSDSRTETSSSTTNTIGVARDIGDLNSWSAALAKLMYILMGHAPDMGAGQSVVSGMRVPSTVNGSSAANVIALLLPIDPDCNSPSKAPPLAEDCCSCAILAVLCASILICGQAAWETHDVSLSILGL